MENNPKKSKAFIITFILILLLLLGGYYLFKNRTKIFDAKGSTSIAKIFSPLLGTSKDKDLKVIDENNTGNGTNTTDTNGNPIFQDEFGNNISNDVNYGGEGSPTFNPISIPGSNSNAWPKTNSPTCKLPQTLNYITNTCQIPTTKCTAPKVYSYMLKACVNEPIPEFCFVNPTDVKCPTYPPSDAFCKANPTYPTCKKNAPTCKLPQTLNYITNTCQIPTTKCTAPKVYSYMLKACVNEPIPEFCFVNPTDVKCPTYPPSDAFCRANPTYPTCKKNAPVCTENQILNLTTNTCETSEDLNKVCQNTATNYPECTTKDGECVDKTMTNPPLCNQSNIVEPNKCLVIEQNPLTFTPEEKARLAVLLRKFYLVSSTLKTSDDITTTYNEIEQQSNFISQTKNLTTQCYQQVDGLMNAGYGWIRHGNPWYTKTSGGSFPYTSDNTGYSGNWTSEINMPATERVLNIW